MIVSACADSAAGHERDEEVVLVDEEVSGRDEERAGTSR